MKHYLKHHSSFIVVVLRSLMHKACVRCGEPLKTFEESAKHWEKELQEDIKESAPVLPGMEKFMEEK